MAWSSITLVCSNATITCFESGFKLENEKVHAKIFRIQKQELLLYGCGRHIVYLFKC